MRLFSEKNKTGTVVALGKFDGVHAGHRELILRATQIAKCDNLKSLVYIISPDNSSNIITDDKRLEILELLGVDFYYKQSLSTEFMAMTPEEFADRILVDELNCAHVVVGYDFRFGNKRCAGVDTLEKLCSERKIKLSVIDEVRLEGADGKIRTVSSTLIRKFIARGDFENVGIYLKSKFTLSGVVCTGRMLGRTLGFPTANLMIGKNSLPIESGVYATLCKTGDVQYLSITNIGNNPTVSDGNPITVETNIFNFTGDLYGKVIEITFLKKIRGEKRFPSLPALKKQIETDKSYVLKKYANKVSGGIYDKKL